MTDASQFLIANLALSAGILLVFLLRKPVRMAFGAAQAYALWLLPPLIAIASFLPPRIIEIVVPADTPPVDIELPAAEGFVSISGNAPASASLAPREIAGMLWEIAPVIWIGGILLMILWLASSQARFMASVRLGTAGPAVVGLFRPRVITPSDFDARFEPNERDVILDHENVHLRRNDARINAFAALLRCICWFNPLVHLAAHFLRIDQEMACDAAVIARRPQARRLYADALIKTQLAARPLPLGCYWPPGAEHPLTERIAMLKRKRPGRIRRRAGVALFVTLALGAGLAAWAAIPAQRQLVFERDHAAETQAGIARPAEQVPPPPTKLEAPKPAPAPTKPALELPEAPKPAPFPARDAIERVFPEAATTLPVEYDANTPVTLKGRIESVTVAPYARSLTLTVKATSIADGLGRSDQAFKPDTQTWRMPFGSASWAKAYTERAVGQEITVRGYRAKDRTCNPDCLLYARDINFHSADFFAPVPRANPDSKAITLLNGRRVAVEPQVTPGSENHPWQTVFNISAETVMVDTKRKTATYEGNVALRFKGYTWRADKLTIQELKPTLPASSVEVLAKTMNQDVTTDVFTYEGDVQIRFGDVLIKTNRITAKRGDAAFRFAAPERFATEALADVTQNTLILRDFARPLPPEAPQAAQALPRPLPAAPALAPDGPAIEQPQPAKPAPARLDQPAGMPPSGHRPFAKYFDAEDPVLLRGAIDHVDFDQPRALVWVKGVASRAGGQSPAPEIWVAEGGSPDTLTEAMRAALKPGTEIVVRGYNSKDKSCDPTCWMNARDVTFADGTKLLEEK